MIIAVFLTQASLVWILEAIESNVVLFLFRFKFEALCFFQLYPTKKVFCFSKKYYSLFRLPK